MHVTIHILDQLNHLHIGKKQTFFRIKGYYEFIWLNKCDYLNLPTIIAC